MRVYNRYGRRDNKYKARIKILVRAMTAAGFPREGRSGVGVSAGRPDDADRAEIERVESRLRPASIRATSQSGRGPGRGAPRRSGVQPLGANNVAPHRRPDMRSSMLSTKVTGVPPGDVSDRQMDAVADWADRYGFGEIRISHQQNFVLPDVREARLVRALATAHAVRARVKQRRRS